MKFHKLYLKTSLVLLIFALCLLQCYGKTNVSKAIVEQLTNFQPVTPTASMIKLTSANAINISAPKDGLNKRNIKVNDLSSNANKVSAKSYDPPPEFYRGPGSTVSSHSHHTAIYSSQDNTASGFTSKPITFPADTIERSKFADSSRGYNKWQLQQGPTKGYDDDLRDRISVGHYGSPDHSTTHGGSSASYLHGSGISAGYGGGDGGGYAGNGYSYTDIPRPYTHHNDYDGGPRYPVATHGSGSSGYYIGSHSDEAGGGGGGGIPFDVYGSKGHYAGGAGGDYSYSSYPDIHETAAHKGGYGVDWQRKALLAKSFLIPLASAAVLGIAAAFVSNPLLLQLGTVTGPAVVGKRRKRRDLSQEPEPTILEGLEERQSAGQSLAYRRHRRHHRHHRQLTRI